MTPQFLRVHEAPTEAEAHKLKGYLEQNGLRVVVRARRPDFKAGSVSGEDIAPRHLEPHGLHVPKDQKRQAEALIADYYRKQPQFPEQ